MLQRIGSCEQEMSRELKNIITGIIFALLGAITLIGFTNLSGEIAIHFNAHGQPDNFMSLLPGLLILPALSLVLYSLFEYIPRLDPLEENYENFDEAYQLLKISVIGILTYVQGMIVAWNLGYQYNPTILVVPVIFTAFYLSGKVMEKAEKNWFIGIRNPWTLSSDRVWEKTHQKTAPLMKASAFIALGAIIVPRYAFWIFLVPVLATVLFSTLYSLKLYREENSE